MKKWLSILLAAIMVLAALPVAFADEATEHMELTVAVWDIANSYPENTEKDAILKEVEAKFNVTFVPMNVGWGDYSDKYMTWAAAGTMPDIAGGIDIVGGGRYIQWVEDGVVRPLPSDLSKYPNVQKYVSLPEAQAYAVDGENYFFPRMTYKDPTYWCMDRGLIIRKDWLKALNLEMPTTADELLKVMQAFVENDPDGDGEKNTIGFGYELVFPTSQHIPYFGYTDNRWVKMGDDWKQPVYEEVTLPLIDMLRTAYKNGWMDQDFTARKPKDCENLFASGRLGILGKQNSPTHVKTMYDLWNTNQPDKDFFECVGIVPFSGEDCTMFQEMAYWSETYIGSQVSDAKLDRIMQIMEYLYSDEGAILTSYGYEGTDFHYDENKNIVVDLPLNADGTQSKLFDKYPSTGFLSCLAQWNGDLMQYESPTIPQQIRDMCKAEYERRVSEWKSPNLDWQIASLNLPEKMEMSTKASTQWSVIIADTSDTPTEELYKTALAEWNSQGYEACWKAVTKAAQELGK